MTMTVDREDTGRARARRGSSLSDKQVAFAVRDGKAVTATLSTGEKITGHVFGSDDYHWSIVTVSGDIVLVHKSSPSLKIHTDPSIEAATDVVQRLVSSFRAAVMRDHFKQDSSRQTQKD